MYLLIWLKNYYDIFFIDKHHKLWYKNMFFFHKFYNDLQEVEVF